MHNEQELAVVNEMQRKIISILMQ